MICDTSSDVRIGSDTSSMYGGVLLNSDKLPFHVCPVDPLQSVHSSMPGSSAIKFTVCHLMRLCCAYCPSLKKDRRFIVAGGPSSDKHINLTRSICFSASLASSLGHGGNLHADPN